MWLLAASTIRNMATTPEIVTAEELRELLKAPKRSKYHSKKCDCGSKHDSLKECRRSHDLQMMQRSGLISDLQEQVPFVLLPKHFLYGRTRPAVRYYADFTYMEKGIKVIEDTKSPATRTGLWMLKMRLMMEKYGIEVRLS